MIGEFQMLPVQISSLIEGCDHRDPEHEESVCDPNVSKRMTEDYLTTSSSFGASPRFSRRTTCVFTATCDVWVMRCQATKVASATGFRVPSGGKFASFLFCHNCEAVTA